MKCKTDSKSEEGMKKKVTKMIDFLCSQVYIIKIKKMTHVIL